MFYFEATGGFTPVITIAIWIYTLGQIIPALETDFAQIFQHIFV